MNRKAKYHHGTLDREAMKRGLEIVAEQGPMALTMRGLARELGVTASALVYYYGNRAGLRAAVARTAAERMRPFSVVRSGGLRAGQTLRATAHSWVEFATKNPNLYRLIFGEGWRGGSYPTLPRRDCVHSVDRISNIGQMSRHIQPCNPNEHGWQLFTAMHGLAFSLADGACPPKSVGPIIDRFVRSIENPRKA